MQMSFSNFIPLSFHLLPLSLYLLYFLACSRHWYHSFAIFTFLYLTCYNANLHREKTRKIRIKAHEGKLKLCIEFQSI